MNVCLGDVGIGQVWQFMAGKVVEEGKVGGKRYVYLSTYHRPTPSVDVSKDVSASFLEQRGSVGNVLSKLMISFVKETGCPSVSKVNNTEKSRKPTMKYAEMYRSQRPRGNQRNWNNQKSQQLGSDFVMIKKACYGKERMHKLMKITLVQMDARLRGGMSMIKKLMQKLLLLVAKFDDIAAEDLSVASEGCSKRQKYKIRKAEDFQSRRFNSRSSSKDIHEG
ncbi:hypothetical protein Tco_0065206 [Tanacetum coccineum]